MASAEALLVPDFIKFLFSSKPKFDCFFKVGNNNQGKPERIGAVKLMLMAHSEVFRLELEYSELKEKGDVPVKDIHPDTFKGMLKYVYGHDTTSDMCFDEADNLLYVAEKYMMKTLKDKLAVRLMKLLNPDNICSLLNNPACYRHLELNSMITDILRYDTDRILNNPQFLLMNADNFLKILQQDGLAVTEIELWRAAISWAKHRANSEEGQLLRDELSGLTKHLRLCTLTGDELVEVIESDVLTRDECKTICLYKRTKEKPQNMGDFSNETEPRKVLHRKKIVQIEKELSIDCICTFFAGSREYNLSLLTKNNSIEGLRLKCLSATCSGKVDFTVTITKVVNPHDTDSSSVNRPVTTVAYCENVKHDVGFEVPLAVDGRNATLLPDTKYTVKIRLDGNHRQYGYKSSRHEDDHLTVVSTADVNGYYYFPFYKLQYRVATAVYPSVS